MQLIIAGMHISACFSDHSPNLDSTDIPFEVSPDLVS